MVTATRERNKRGGTMPANTIEAKPEADAPKGDGPIEYTIITPEPSFSDVRMRHQFYRGRTTTRDENIARQFVQDYGYACEPALPPPPPRKRTRRRDRGFASA
jgi:hypothetical protein